MDHKALNRLCIGAQAIGMLGGMLRSGAFVNVPQAGAMAQKLCDEWNEMMLDDGVPSYVETKSGSALPRPGSEASA